jgi:hypothetical protein
MKRATKKKNRRSSTADLHLWLVPFTFERPRTKQRGSFQMVVEAVTPDDALDRCHERLVELAATTVLFKEPIKLYSDGLVRLTGRFNEPVLLNFELPDERGRISNLMPEQAEHDAMMFVADHDATGRNRTGLGAVKACPGCVQLGARRRMRELRSSSVDGDRLGRRRR